MGKSMKSLMENVVSFFKQTGSRDLLSQNENWADEIVSGYIGPDNSEAREAYSHLSPSITNPTEIPATGLLIGTPAAIRPKVAAHTLAIDDDPLDSRMSEITRIV